MSKKITCNMVNDMLPLYVDNVLSEESKEAVAEHLEQCPKCRQTISDMNVDLECLHSITDTDNSLFKRVKKEFRKMYLLRTVIIIVLLGILWFYANFYISEHYNPVNPEAQTDYIEECLEVVMIDDCYYLHQTDFFALGDIIVLESSNGVFNFYLGENGIRSLGLSRSYMITPKYQQLIGAEMMDGDITINYCKPDGTVITTLWKSGDEITQLHSQNGHSQP